MDSPYTESKVLTNFNIEDAGGKTPVIPSGYSAQILWRQRPQSRKMVKGLPGSESGACQDPPSAQSPFAGNRCYLLLCCVLSNSMIIHTYSCCRHARTFPPA